MKLSSLLFVHLLQHFVLWLSVFSNQLFSSFKLGTNTFKFIQSANPSFPIDVLNIIEADISLTMVNPTLYKSLNLFFSQVIHTFALEHLKHVLILR